MTLSITRVRKRWFKLNPPDIFGYYSCYLRIAPLCLYRLEKDQVTLDHVRARSNRHDLRYDVNNLMPACTYCNNLKGSQSLENLQKSFPHLQKVISELNEE